jgi:hypothetical protein
MLDSDFEDKLKIAITQLELNFKRMNYAYSRTEKLIPFNNDSIQNFKPEQVSFIDQYIYRFAKIQDLMGNKLFPMILQAIGEDTEKMAFLDVLNRLEKLEVIEDRNIWLDLRKIRDEVSHEYPLYPPRFPSGSVCYSLPISSPGSATFKSP